MMRSSNYTIYVDLPDEPDQMLLVHGYTGAYDKVSRGVATYVRALQDGPVPKPLYGEWTPEPTVDGDVPAPTDQTIEILRRRGYLTDLDQEAEEKRFQKMVTKLHHLQSLMMPAYIMMPTYSCNLRCSYCFQDHMRTNPAFRHLLRTMTPEMADRIFQVMPEIEDKHGVTDDTVPRMFTFFGGEPLLEQTRPIVEYIVNKALDSGPARFSAVSNATDLQHFTEVLGPEKIASIQITLDGSPPEHDKRRIYTDGSGSFERIAKNIDLALDLGVRISVRMNIDRNNIHDLPVLAEEITARGWPEYKNFSTYTAPVHASNDNTDRKTTMTSWQLDQRIGELREVHDSMQVVGRPDDGLVDRVQQLFGARRSGIPNFKASFCGAHNKMYIFDSFGDIYACWERTGDQQIRIGHVTEEGPISWDNELNELWRQRTVVSNPVCRKCRYSLYCGGGCAALAQAASGTLYKSYCDGFQKRFRATVAEAYLNHIHQKQHEPGVERACDV